MSPAPFPSLSPTAARSPALTASGLIELLWLASPGLPVGGFSYSEGLEAAIDAGHVSNEAQAQTWLLAQQALVLGRAEMPLVAAAWRAWQHGEAGRERVCALNDWVVQTRDSGEARLQTLQMGRSMAEWLRQRQDDDAWRFLQGLTPAPTWPVAFALALHRSGAPLHDGLVAFGFGWAENMVQAAVKAVPLGQSAGQRLLGALAAPLPALAASAELLPDAQRQSFAPVLAILGARHECQYSRLFRS